MEVNPVTQTVLDVAPYDVVSILCNVTQPREVALSKRVSWVQTSSTGGMQELTHSGTSTRITNRDLDRPSSSSMLSLQATTAGRWSYMCTFSIQVPRDSVISYSQTAEVIVKGIQLIVMMYQSLTSTLLYNYRPICSKSTH